MDVEVWGRLFRVVGSRSPVLKPTERVTKAAAVVQHMSGITN